QTIPDYVTVDTATLPPGAVYDPVERVVSWEMGAVGPGETVQIRFKADVGAAPAGSELVSELVLQADGPYGAYTAQAVFYVGNWPEIWIEKVADRDSAGIGEIVRYRIRVENRDDAILLLAAFVRDRLPEGFAYLNGSSRVDAGGVVTTA